MLPADTIAEITTAIAGLHLESNVAGQILAAVLTPLLRDVDPAPFTGIKSRTTGLEKRRSKRRDASQQKRKYHRHHPGPSEPRQRAIEALKAKPDATNKEIADRLRISPSTVHNARTDLAKEQRKEACRAAQPKRETADLRARAQNFLRRELANGPQQVSSIEEHAEKSRISPNVLEQARVDLGIVVSRSNAGGVQAAQWSLPG